MNVDMTVMNDSSWCLSHPLLLGEILGIASPTSASAALLRDTSGVIDLDVQDYVQHLASREHHPEKLQVFAKTFSAEEFKAVIMQRTIDILAGIVSDKRGVRVAGRPKVYCSEVLAYIVENPAQYQFKKCIKRPQRSAASFATDWMTAENGPAIIRQPGYIQFLEQDAKCSWLPWEGPYIIPVVLTVLFMLLVAFDTDTVHSRSGSSDEYMHPACRCSCHHHRTIL
jgi:hypothetical protein